MTSPTRHLALVPRANWPLRPGSVAYAADQLDATLEDVKPVAATLAQTRELVALYWLRSARPRTRWARFVWALRLVRGLWGGR
jgi:hypothetical protein